MSGPRFGSHDGGSRTAARFVVGVGVDITGIDRFERLLDRGASGVWRHWFTVAEAEQCRQDPHPARAAALRFAVKEAAYKSLGAEFAGEVRWHDIEVLAAADSQAGRSAWRIGLRGEVAALGVATGVDRFHVSTDLYDTHAWATVIAEGRPTEPEAIGTGSHRNRKRVMMRLRSDNLVMQEIDGETVLLDLAGSTYFASNRTGTFLLQLLKSESGYDELVTALAEEFDLTPHQAATDTDAFLAMLQGHDLLV